MSPLQLELLSRMGETLLQIQTAEEQLQLCISYFLPADTAKTVEEIESQAEAVRKKTLGQLLTLMRKRIVVSEIFDGQLDQFLEDRNALAHRFLRVEGVSLKTDEGLKKGIEFLKGLSAQAVHIRKTIQGLMRAIMGEDTEPGEEADEQYAELAKLIFGGK